VRWKEPTVFDNLIYKKEIPITLGVFVMHGRMKAVKQDEALDRFNRCFEFDGLGDSYVKFILKEIYQKLKSKILLTEGQSNF
jgi:gluconolactonase